MRSIVTTGVWRNVGITIWNVTLWGAFTISKSDWYFHHPYQPLTVSKNAARKKKTSFWWKFIRSYRYVSNLAINNCFFQNRKKKIPVTDVDFKIETLFPSVTYWGPRNNWRSTHLVFYEKSTGSRNLDPCCQCNSHSRHLMGLSNLIKFVSGKPPLKIWTGTLKTRSDNSASRGSRNPLPYVQGSLSFRPLESPERTVSYNQHQPSQAFRSSVKAGYISWIFAATSH
jgi:hypothetical protein